MNDKNKIYQLFMVLSSVSLLLGQYIRFFSKIAALIIIVGTGIYLFIKIRLSKSIYTVQMCWMLALLVIGIIISHLYYLQSVQRSIIILLPTFASVLIYYVYSDFVYMNKIDEDSIKRIIYFIAVLSVVMFLLQCYLGPKIVLFKVAYGFRHDRARFYFQNLGIVLGVCVAVSELVRRSMKDYIFGVGLIVASLFEILYFQQYRMTTCALLCAVAISYYYSISPRNKCMFLALIIPIAVLLFATNKELQFMFSSFINGTDTFANRAQAIPYYAKQLRGHWFLGRGFVISDIPYNNAAVAAGYKSGFYLNDNGIFGFLYMYGVAGVLWFVFTWYKMLKNGFYIFNKTGNIIGILFPIFIIIALRTEANWFWNAGMIVISLFMVYTEAIMYKISSESCEM